MGIVRMELFDFKCFLPHVKGFCVMENADTFCSNFVLALCKTATFYAEMQMHNHGQ